MKYILLVALLACIAYCTILFNEFTFDDHVLIENNPTIRTMQGIVDVTFKPVPGENVSVTAEQGLRTWIYRPLSFLLFYLIGSISAFKPFGFHCANLLFHCFNSVLVYLLCKRLFLSVQAAFFSATLFAVHPIHTDAVASAMSAPEEFAFFFGLISFLLLLSAVRYRYLLASLSYFAALMAKENAVIFVVVYIGIMIYLHVTAYKKLDIKQAYSTAPVFIVPLIFYFLLRYRVTGVFLRNLDITQLSIDNPLLQAGAGERFLTSIYIVCKYILLFFIPFGLSADYSLGSLKIIKSAGESRFLLSLVVLSVILGVLIMLIRKKRYVESLGLFIFFIGLLPFSNVFFMSETILAERYLYFPSLGLCILIGVIGSWLIGQNEKKRGTAVYAVFIIIVVVMLVMSIWRNTVWKNDATLFKSVLRIYPGNIKALNNLAVIHFNKGEYREAIPLYEEIVQKYPQVYPAQARLIFAHYSLANYDKAIAYGRKAIQYFSNDENIYDLLGEVYEKASKPNDAIAVYKKGIKVMPKSFLMNFRLGAWYQKAGDCKKAETYLQSALKISNDVNVHYYLGKCYYSEGRGKKALNEFIKCTKVYKRYPDILKYIILLHIDFNNFALAEQIAAQYVKEFPEEAEAWAVTGKLYWQGTRDSNYAKQFIQKALVLDSKVCTKIDYIAVCRAVGY